MGLTAGEAETVTGLQQEVSLTYPQLELAAQYVSRFFAFMAVVLLAIRTRREA